MSLACVACGNGMAVGDKFCRVCGYANSMAFPVSPATGPGITPPETSWKAILSLCCGLFLASPLAIAGVVLGHLALSEIRKRPDHLGGKELAIAGLVLGYVGLAIFTIILTTAMVVIPRVLRSSIPFQESSPVAALRTLNMAEIAYAQAHPAIGYTCSLSDLTGSWGISGELASGRKEGYLFTLRGCSSRNLSGPIARYELLVYPEDRDQVGKPAFCSNESDVIKVIRKGPPEDCPKYGIELSQDEINRPQER